MAVLQIYSKSFYRFTATISEDTIKDEDSGATDLLVLS